ncbi:phosphatase PAP2 family protein [Glaciecola sp. XM2]|uniref:phosphatase PAP2 family protein n=1 Tax=Glaciecola sp. XM2 TaxID=1914931 RepID=UPI001BDE061B|nr:phosphatase PAP2 family protein [Glaciecola sp. XM2]MBT1451728.1 phosphatase PAP2 family protein [Glaciecola sp. XM2]
MTLPGRPASQLFRYVSKTGDGHLYLFLGATLFYFDKQHGALFFYTALLAYAFEIPMYLTLKHLFKRQRPCDVLLHYKAHIVPSDKFSLPSGHTAAAFLMATIIMHFYPGLGVVAYVWASLVGLSRVVLRVHYPLDVIIGALLGVSVACGSIYALG